ncbi:MAG TPA: hypothetical protein DCR35_13540 [Runella sp.]|nr:hypothetical protein [Runella sp.]HAO50223.1 hypothetical protein [Runella sp.]
MKLAQFSQNTLEKEQMAAVKGGNPGYNEYLKKVNGGIWHVQGWSVYNSATGNWDWIDNGSHWEIMPTAV